MRERLYSAAAALILSASTAQGAGFHIDEQDGRATGRAGAVTANPGNGSAIYYNPAGVANLRGFQLQAGVALVRPTATFRPQGDGVATDAPTSVHPLPHAYATYRMDELVAVGFGLTTPFGLAVDWPADSPGRASVRHIELRTFFMTPTVALNLSRWVPGLSIGGGANLVASSVRLERDILFGSEVASVALSGTAFGGGATAGIIYRPGGVPWLALGANYRSPVKLEFEGEANFSASPVYRGNLPPDGRTLTNLKLPQKFNAGVAVRPVPTWELELDVNWTGWSSYKSLVLELPGNQTAAAEKDWNDAVAVRLGTELALGRVASLRGGVAWDRTPVPTRTLDFQLPDANRLILTAGLGAKAGTLLRGDLGVLYIPPAQATTSLEDPYRPAVKGTFEASALVVALSVGFTLDAEPVKLDSSQ